MKRPSSQRRGFSIIETIVYVAILVMIAGLVVNVLIVMIRSYTQFRVSRNVASAAQASLERMEREVRQASDLDDAGSTYGANPGVLKLISTDSSGNPLNITFSVATSTLYIQEGAGTPTSLLPLHAQITNLIFRRIATTTSKAIKIEMTLQDDRDRTATSYNFYDTATLRGSY